MLRQYIMEHAQRGECNCGKCIDRGERADPEGHTADVFFFRVATMNEPDETVFKKLVEEHHGEFCDCDPFDGAEHNYIELGGWLGDQGAALLFMGLGSLLGVFKLFTPNNCLPDDTPDSLKKQMAGAGMIAVRDASKPGFKEAMAALTPAGDED